MKQSISSLVLVLVAIMTAVTAGAQIYDGRAVVDTAQYVAVATGYPQSLVSLAVPSGTITSITLTTDGPTLAGNNLGLSSPQTIHLQAPGWADLTVSWAYKAENMADGSGTAVYVDINFTTGMFLQSTSGTQMRKIVLRPTDTNRLFLNRNEYYYMALQQSGFYYYYYGGSPTYTGGSLNLNLSPYSLAYQWWNYDPFAGVNLGAVIFVNFVP